jgi:hypothetical protein
LAFLFSPLQPMNFKSFRSIFPFCGCICQVFNPSVGIVYHASYSFYLNGMEHYMNQIHSDMYKLHQGDINILVSLTLHHHAFHQSL